MAVRHEFYFKIIPQKDFKQKNAQLRLFYVSSACTTLDAKGLILFNITEMRMHDFRLQGRLSARALICVSIFGLPRIDIY